VFLARVAGGGSSLRAELRVALYRGDLIAGGAALLVRRTSTASVR
jgi:hypothetical protein